MIRTSILGIVWFFCAQTIFGSIHEKDSTYIKNKLSTPDLKEEKFVWLPELEKQFPFVNKGHLNEMDQITNFGFPLPANSINDERAEAEESFKEINASGRWVDSFRNEDIQVLPVGVKHVMGGVEYQLGFAKAVFSKEYAELTVFAKIILPQSNSDGTPREIFFGANNIKLSHDGGIIGEANLALLGDYFVPFNDEKWILVFKGGANFRTGNMLNTSYVTIDCDGVKSIGLQGELQITRELVLPLDQNGNLGPENRTYTNSSGQHSTIPNRVTGAFNVVASDFNDVLVNIDLPPFVLANHPNKFSFSVNEAVLDFSDSRNQNITFPKQYHEQGLLLPNPQTWRGVYIKSLEVGLPTEFKTKQSISQNKRVSFEAADVIIDHYGVSGFFSVNNLIQIDEGRTSKKDAWQFSVDEFGVRLVTSKLTEGKIKGQIALPISKVKKDGSSTLGYEGIITENEYTLKVSTLEKINFDIFKAKGQLLPNSYVELRVSDEVDGQAGYTDDIRLAKKTFLPKAVLNGRMAISANQKSSLENEGEEYTTVNENGEQEKKLVEFKGISFQNLKLQTVAPKFEADYFGYDDEVKLANFPISISDIGFIKKGALLGLEFNLHVNLMSKGFAGTTRLGIFAKEDLTENRLRYKYSHLDLTEAHVDGDLGAVKIKGSLLLMNNDPIYGNGFSAEIAGTFGSFGPITCKAIFGKKDFRYWYVDAAVHGLTIQAGPITLTGFAGGAFYRMTRKPDAGPDFSPSGLAYVPSEDSSLGVKAALIGAIARPEAVSVSAGFEIEFNNSGGVNKIGLFGEAQITKAFSFDNPVGELSGKLGSMVEKTALAGAAETAAGKTFLNKADSEFETEVEGKVGVNAKLGMEYDFQNKSFHATLDIYANVAGGMLQGRASGGRAGWGVVHIEPGEWYAHMGTPTDRLGLRMGVGSVSIEAGGYMMIGDRMPGSPPPPPEVTEILGVSADELDYMRDENSLNAGRGFAFGSDFKIDTGDLNMLMLYARFQSGVGFDLMLKDYGEASCVNTGDQIGINGWYANGQAYAYLQGELGIQVKLFMIRKKIPIIKGAAAILMQGKGPNPFWFRGYAAGNYDLLGGTVTGDFRFKVEIGEVCEFDDGGSPLEGLQMISDLTPKEGDNQIDVFTAPQAAFTMKMNQPVVIQEDTGDKTYRMILEEFSLTNSENVAIESELEWNTTNDKVTLLPKDVLAPNHQYTAKVTVSFQEKVNGVYQPVEHEGMKVTEIKEVSFTTGEAPDYIPLRNLKYTYPVVDQQGFFRDEYDQGYIQLKQGQDYLFDDSQWQSSVKIIDENGNEESVPINYSQAANSITYTMQDLDKENAYTVSIVSSPKNVNAGNGNTNDTQKVNLVDDANGNTMEVKQNLAQSVSVDGEIERITYAFKTSTYKTFKDKINAIVTTDYFWHKVDSKVLLLSNKLRDNKGFDLVELVGNEYTDHQPLVTVTATLEDRYFTEDIHPLLYRDFENHSQFQLDRDISIYGFVPAKAVPVMTNYLTGLENNIDHSWRRTTFPYWYCLMDLYSQDYLDLYNKVTNAYVDGGLGASDPAYNLIGKTLPYMRTGEYRIQVQYILPGNVSGSAKEYKFKNLTQ